GSLHYTILSRAWTVQFRWRLGSQMVSRPQTAGTEFVGVHSSGAISGSQDGAMKLWDLEGGTAIRPLAGHIQWVRAVTVTQDGRRAISAARDRTLILWNLHTGDALATLNTDAAASSCVFA